MLLTSFDARLRDFIGKILMLTEHYCFLNMFRLKVFSLLIIFLFSARIFAQQRIYRIGTISLERKNIFDENKSTEGNFIGSTVNSLHVLTREDIIRNELLIGTGDIYDQALIDESARNLRALSFIGDVSILPDTLNDSTINMNVKTYDKWTINFSPSYQQGGDNRDLSLHAKDDNLMGRGQNLSLGYNYKSDLVNPHGYEFIFSDRRAFGTRWGMKIQYKSSQDQKIKTLLIERGFYSDEAAWASGFYFDAGSLVIPFYQNGLRTNELNQDQQNHNAYFAGSFGDKVKIRPAIAWVGVNTQAERLRPSDNLGLLNLSLSLMHREYKSEHFLDNHGRTEDVPLGYLGGFLMGKNFCYPAGNEPAYLLCANLLYAFDIGHFFYASCSFAASMLTGRDAMHESTVQGSVICYLKPADRHTIVLRGSGISGIGWSRDRLLYLGNSTGLRGFENFAFSGQKIVLYNIEDRLYPDIELWIFRLGTALFVDGGATWNRGSKISDGMFHTSGGFGLRIENTKQEGPGIIRIDLAFNFDEKKIGQLVISSNIPFSAFNNFGFISPVTTGYYQQN